MPAMGSHVDDDDISHEGIIKPLASLTRVLVSPTFSFPMSSQQTRRLETCTRLTMSYIMYTN